MTAACLASLFLGIFMIIIVMASHHFHINPDNVATPIAASLGDLITLSLLSSIAHGLYQIKGDPSSILCVLLHVHLYMYSTCTCTSLAVNLYGICFVYKLECHFHIALHVKL